MDLLQQIENKLKYLEQNKVLIENKLEITKNELISDTGSFKVNNPNYNAFLSSLQSNQNNTSIDYNKHKKKNQYLINNKYSNFNKVKFNDKFVGDYFYKIKSYIDLDYQQCGVALISNDNVNENYFNQRENTYLDDLFN